MKWAIKIARGAGFSPSLSSKKRVRAKVHYSTEGGSSSAGTAGRNKRIEPAAQRRAFQAVNAYAKGKMHESNAFNATVFSLFFEFKCYLRIYQSGLVN